MPDVFLDWKSLSTLKHSFTVILPSHHVRFSLGKGDIFSESLNISGFRFLDLKSDS